MGDLFIGEELAQRDGLYVINAVGEETMVPRHEWWQQQVDAIQGEEVITVSTLDEVAALGGEENNGNSN